MNNEINFNKVLISGVINAVTDVANNSEEIIKGRKVPHIREDDDSVLIWDGNRCESTPATLEEQKKMEEMLSEYK